MAEGDDFTIIAGTSRTIEFTVLDSAAAVVNITGLDIVWVTSLTTDGVPVLTKSTDVVTEIAITDGANGVFEVYMLPADTSAVADGTLYYHEARIIDGTVEVVVHQGTFTVTYSNTYGHMPP